MEITLEMVERLKEKADVTYAQAKQALEYSGGNLLDALIYLEEQGAIPRQEGTYFTTRGEAPPPHPPAAPAGTTQAPDPEQPEGREHKAKKAKGKKPGEKREGGGLLATLRRWLVENELEIWRHDQPITALPVLILILLVLFAFWLVLAALVVSLFLGFRYRFSGPDLEREELNNMMGTVADTASDIGHKVMEELKHDWHSDEKKDGGGQP